MQLSSRRPSCCLHTLQCARGFLVSLSERWAACWTGEDTQAPEGRCLSLCPSPALWQGWGPT